MPFNELQFDRCALWLAMRLPRSLTQYDLIKFHVMTDIYHVLEYGRPVIGGAVVKWKFGPVVPRAYHRLMREALRFQHGREEGDLHVDMGPGNIYRFSARSGAVVDEDEFSQSEINAMERAMKIVRMGWSESQRFFHVPAKSFVGKVWASTDDGCPIDWNRIIDAYDQEHQTDHSHIKTLISLGV